MICRILCGPSVRAVTVEAFAAMWAGIVFLVAYHGGRDGWLGCGSGRRGSGVPCESLDMNTILERDGRLATTSKSIERSAKEGL